MPPPAHTALAAAGPHGDSAAAPPSGSRVGLLLALLALAAAVLLPLAALWELAPSAGGSAVQRPAAAAPLTQATSVALTNANALAVERLAAMLKDGLHCATPNPFSEPLGSAQRPDEPMVLQVNHRLDACLAEQAGLEQVFVLNRLVDAEAAWPVRADRERQLDLRDARMLAALTQAAATQQKVHALAPGSTRAPGLGIDQIVPLKGLAAPAALVLRYRWARLAQDSQLGQQTGHLQASMIDPADPDASEPRRGEGLEVRDASGLRLVLQAAAAEGALPAAAGNAGPGRSMRAVLSLLTLALLGAGASGLLVLVRNQQRQQRAAQAQLGELQAKDRAISQEAAFRRDVQESVSVGLRVIDAQGCITDVNQAFVTMSGWPRAQLVGSRPPYCFWPQDQHADRLQLLQALLAGQPAGPTYQLGFVRPDGSAWTAKVQARPLGQGDGWILDCADMTGELEVQRRIQDMNEQLRQHSAIWLLGARAGDLLHQMGNFAGACATNLRYLRKGVRGELDQVSAATLAEAAEDALQSANRMVDLVERFRPWIMAQPALEPVALHDVVADAFLQQRFNADAHQVELDNLVSKRLPLLVLDRAAMWQVVSNLVSNSIRAMAEVPPDNRRVMVEALRDEAAQVVALHVRDHGHGIPPAQQARLFEQGRRGSSGGSGWGLFISRQWVTRLGGSIELVRSSAAGTHILITLPLQPASQAPSNV